MLRVMVTLWLLCLHTLVSIFDNWYFVIVVSEVELALVFGIDMM